MDRSEPRICTQPSAGRRGSHLRPARSRRMAHLRDHALRSGLLLGDQQRGRARERILRAFGCWTHSSAQPGTGRRSHIFAALSAGWYHPAASRPPERPIAGEVTKVGSSAMDRPDCSSSSPRPCRLPVATLSPRSAPEGTIPVESRGPARRIAGVPTTPATWGGADS